MRCAGHGRLMLIGGEPGIGKSRLADELAARATARGALVLVGRCWEAGGAPAYWPWMQSLRRYVRDTDTATLRSQLDLGAMEVARLVPELRTRLPDLGEPPSLETEGARFRLFDATSEFLRRACERRPIVLVLDDLHAADVPSLLLLRFLAQELGSMRMLVMAAYRDVAPRPGPDLAELLAAVVREPATRRVSLSGLSRDEAAEYVDLTAPELASAQLVAALHEETEGNPLFVGEIVRLLAAEGVDAPSAAEGRRAVPRSLRDVIARRLTHLSDECNRVLVLASVLGREFALAPLVHMSDVSEDELLDLADEAIADRVLSDLPAGAGRLRFEHVLIRDTLYDGLTSARRVRLHRQAVQALEALYGSEPGPHLSELAHHAMAGGEFEHAVAYARRAGSRELASLAYEEAPADTNWRSERTTARVTATSTCVANSSSRSATRSREQETTPPPNAPSSTRPCSQSAFACRASMLGQRWATAGGSSRDEATSGSCRCSRPRSRRWAATTSSSAPGCCPGWRERSATSAGAIVATR